MSTLSVWRALNYRSAKQARSREATIQSARGTILTPDSLLRGHKNRFALVDDDLTAHRSIPHVTGNGPMTSPYKQICMSFASSCSWLTPKLSKAHDSKADSGGCPVVAESGQRLSNRALLTTFDPMPWATSSSFSKRIPCLFFFASFAPLRRGVHFLFEVVELMPVAHRA